MNSYILSIKFLFFFLVDKNGTYKESSKFDTIEWNFNVYSEKVTNRFDENLGIVFHKIR